MKVVFWIRKEALDRYLMTGFAQAHLRREPFASGAIWVELEAEVTNSARLRLLPKKVKQ